jgi:hypothetical protein
MVASRKYKETLTCRLTEGRPDSVLYTEMVVNNYALSILVLR